MIQTKDNAIVTLLKSKITVFETKDLVLLWRIFNPNYLKTKIYRLVKTGQLIRIQNGLYTIDSNYNRMELANKMFCPSYVTLQTVLNRSGINFQYDRTIYSLASRNFKITIGSDQFIYRKIKSNILFNPIGINRTGNISIASLERAIVDMLYMDKDFYFDKLDNVDLEKCLEIAESFQNKRVTGKIKSLLNEQIKEQNA